MKIKILYVIIALIAIPVVVILGCYLSVDYNAHGRTFDNVADVPEHEYGLLLGTSPITPQGAHNFYFDNRIKAAVELYKAGKVKKIIASGGNYWRDENGNSIKNGCNELRSMQDSLIKYGVPRENIILDYDGTRTLNSIVKTKEVFGIDSCVIISQQYHNERAIKQADHYGLKAVGYNAAPSHIRRNRIKNQARELLARVKLYLDLWFGSKPKFDSYVVSVGNDILQEWYDEVDSVPGIKGAVAHRSDIDSSYGFYRYFSTKNGKHIYYNVRHGYYVVLPNGMGYNQSGENMMGIHGNEFYNNDTTLVVSVYAMYYDVILLDEPHYVDSLKIYERQFLKEMGDVKTDKLSSVEWISQGRISHSSSENSSADRFIRKWLLKKDIDGRECEMELTIYYNDTLSYRLPELEHIIKQFPNLPKTI
ncbi:MAG: YdcF family protein [Muribaculum sp.]|nr:YdcF family protein [Muribaculum sp.]